jgi:pectin methylesterase-like acyl-CoA thioesterase
MTRAGAVAALVVLALASAACAASQPWRSGGARPARDLLVSTKARLPVAGSIDVCPDVRLKLTFEGPVALGTSGAIRVFAAANPGTPAATVDLAATSHSDVIGGRRFALDRPVFVDDRGREVTIVLPTGALAAGGGYFVTVDDGAFYDDRGNSYGAVTGPTAWRFSTRAARPAADLLTVAADGSGDFCTVQGAVDAVPARNTVLVTIAIRPGRYHEIVLIAGKSNIRLLGGDRRNTVIAYANNDKLQANGGPKLRALVSVENAADVTVENLTLRNLTPQGGGPAEALRVEPGDRVSVRHVDLVSRQDTLLLTGRVHVSESYVEGNVDFVGGQGIAFFERCELKTVGRPGTVVQPRNPANRLGFVFYDCMFTADTGLTGSFLARIDATRFPASQVAFIFCMLGPHLDPAGWLVTPPDTFTGELRLWEYDNRGLDTPFLSRTGRHPAARLLTAAAADKLRNSVNVLGGWDPAR